VSKKRDDHPDRKDIIKAAQTGVVPFKDHLRLCRDCRELFDYFLAYIRSAPEGILYPSDEALAKHKAIPLVQSSRASQRRVEGRVTYDSWSRLPAIALRDVGKGMERRLRMKAGDITLELSAERRSDRWEFTARAYRKDRVVSPDYILKAGRVEVAASELDCYYWSSQRPPRRLKLLCGSLAIDFGTLQWR